MASLICSLSPEPWGPQGEDGHTARGLAPVLAFLKSHRDLQIQRSHTLLPFLNTGGSRLRAPDNLSGVSVGAQADYSRVLALQSGKGDPMAGNPGSDVPRRAALDDRAGSRWPPVPFCRPSLSRDPASTALRKPWWQEPMTSPPTKGAIRTQVRPKTKEATFKERGFGALLNGFHSSPLLPKRFGGCPGRRI